MPTGNWYFDLGDAGREQFKYTNASGITDWGRMAADGYTKEQMKEYANQLLQSRGLTAPENINSAYEDIEQVYSNYQGQQNRQMQLDFYNQLRNPSSQYYRNINQQVRDNLSSVYNPNSLLAVARATGLSSGGASTIVNQQRRAQEKRINEYANQATNTAFTNATGQATGLLGLAQQGTLGMGQLNLGSGQLDLEREKLLEQRRQFNESQPGFLDYAGALGGSLLGSALGGEKPWWLGGN